jgi:hypothetical protein
METAGARAVAGEEQVLVYVVGAAAEVRQILGPVFICVEAFAGRVAGGQRRVTCCRFDVRPDPLLRSRVGRPSEVWEPASATPH